MQAQAPPVRRRPPWAWISSRGAGTRPAAAPVHQLVPRHPVRPREPRQRLPTPAPPLYQGVHPTRVALPIPHHAPPSKGEQRDPGYCLSRALGLWNGYWRSTGSSANRGPGGVSAIHTATKATRVGTDQMRLLNCFTAHLPRELQCVPSGQAGRTCREGVECLQTE